MTGHDDLRGLQRSFANALTGRVAPGRPVIEQIRTDRDIPADERLRVYGHAWFARLHAALREDFGALVDVVGEAAFHDLAKLYLMAHPPRSHSLHDLGERLEPFLRGPVARVFAERWPVAADLAALEWALVEVFDAPDAPVLERESLARLPGESWAALRLELVPAHRLLRLDWPVEALYRAWQTNGLRPVLAPAGTSLLVHRRAERVHHRTLAPLEAETLAGFAAGHDFASVCARVAESVGEGEAPAALLEMLERWLAAGLLADPTARQLRAIG